MSLSPHRFYRDRVGKCGNTGILQTLQMAFDHCNMSTISSVAALSSLLVYLDLTRCCTTPEHKSTGVMDVEIIIFHTPET